MRTIIVTSLTTAWSLPLLLGFALLGRGLMCRVLEFLEEHPINVKGQKTTLTAGIWLFATFSMIAALAPVPVADRAAAIVMMAFLLQAGSTDAVSGYLPRTFTDCVRQMMQPLNYDTHFCLAKCTKGRSNPVSIDRIDRYQSKQTVG